MIVYTLNLDYRCNERCVFCAADLGGPVPVEIRRPSLTLDAVAGFFGDEPPGPNDRVCVSGGEPTLHRELLDIVRRVSATCPSVILFTNGTRLADRRYVDALVDAGISRFEISVFGSDPSTHDAVTQRTGSFVRTIAGLRTLTAVRRERRVEISIRLLVSRHTLAQNPRIPQSVAAAEVGPDWFNLNKAILSHDAVTSGAPVSWEEARESTNATLREVRSAGFHATAPTVPWCVWDEDNREWLQNGPSVDEIGGTERVEYRYLDPVLPASRLASAPPYRPALPDPCVSCVAAWSCARVEQGYLRLFGTEGLHPIHDDRLAPA
jgi:MoaA/NifB/PqqE/SkfB family radical SAM enzyme